MGIQLNNVLGSILGGSGSGAQLKFPSGKLAIDTTITQGATLGLTFTDDAGNALLYMGDTGDDVINLIFGNFNLTNVDQDWSIDGGGNANFVTLGTNGDISTQGNLKVSGTKVVGAQGLAVGNADGTLAGATTAINAILARLRGSTGHGLIAG